MRRKAEAKTNTKTKGAMALAEKAAANAKKGAEKNGMSKRGREKESDDELPLSKKGKAGEEVSEEEESEEGSDDASTSSETGIKMLEAESVVNEGRAKLQALERDSDTLKARIEAAKKTNVNKHTELRQTLNAYPSAVSTLSLYNWILHMLIDGLGRNRQ